MYRARLRYSLRALLVLIGVAAFVAWMARPRYLDPSYFPMRVGDKWVYDWDGQDVVFEVTHRERVGEKDCFVVERSVANDSVTFYVGLSTHGAAIHRVNGSSYEPPFNQFQFSTRENAVWHWKGDLGGASFQYSCQNLGEEEITVPVGTFRAFRVHQTSPQGNADFWLAPGVGVVKLEGKVPGHNDPPWLGYFEWSLKEFSRRSE